MNIICTGGRNYDDYHRVAQTLACFKPGMIFVGDANGADNLVATYCEIHGIEHKIFKADWELHGKAAGPIRNTGMIETAEVDPDPDLVVIAFPGGRGTENCIKQAKQRGIIILRVEP